jgi:hypothetical protein
MDRKSCMLDKLEMRTTEQIDFNILFDIFPKHKIKKKYDRYYRTCVVIRKNGKEVITIKAGLHFGGICETKIIINPSKFESFKELTLLLKKICDLRILEITRIDHAIDLSIPIDQIIYGIRVKYKRAQKIFKDFNPYDEYFKENYSHDGSFVTGSYYGQSPELYCIYDKGYKLACDAKKYTRNKLFERRITTRIELRQFKHKIKYKNFMDLINYVDDPPFDGIEFYKINEDIGYSSKRKALELLMNLDGLSRTRAALNEQNNFDRNFKKYLSGTDFSTTLNNLYREELHQFFGITNDASVIIHKASNFKVSDI